MYISTIHLVLSTLFANIGFDLVIVTTPDPWQQHNSYYITMGNATFKRTFQSHIDPDEILTESKHICQFSFYLAALSQYTFIDMTLCCCITCTAHRSEILFLFISCKLDVNMKSQAMKIILIKKSYICQKHEKKIK